MYNTELFDWESEDWESNNQRIWVKNSSIVLTNDENFAELRSEAALRLVVLCGELTQREGLSIFVWRIGVKGLSEDGNLETSDFRCLKDSNSRATGLVSSAGASRREGGQ